MKHLTGFLALFLFAVLPLSAADLSDLTYRITGGEVTITDCDVNARGELVIPDTIEGNPVTSIGDDAFHGCFVLTNITIPDGVTSIGYGAFSGCRALTMIEVGVGNVNYAEVNGVLFNTEMTLLHTYPADKTGANYTIPDGVTSIEESAFHSCKNLTSITIPDSVMSIGSAAFYLCTSLTSITIGDSVTSIGDYAFGGCRSLTSITFQGSAPTVRSDTFWNVPDGAIAQVTFENLGSYRWNGLNLSTADQSAAIADLEAQLAEAIAQRDAAITERDARPTAEALAMVEAVRDAVIAGIQLAFDEVNAAAGGAEADLVVEIVDPENAPSEVQSVGVVALALESFAVNTFASPANLDTEMALYDSAGTLIVTNDDAPSAARPEGAGNLLSQLNFPDGLAGGLYYLAVGTYDSIFNNSDFEVSSTGQGGEYTLTLPTGQVSGTLEASGIDWYRIEIGTNFAALQLQPLTELYRNLVEANASAILERDAAIEERDARPTTDQLAAVEAERDARYTEDQIRGLSADYTIGLNEAGNVQMKFNLFESADLTTFAPLTLTPESVSVVDGSICLEFAPEDRAAFFRFSVE